jgi:hypothetical protein
VRLTSSCIGGVGLGVNKAESKVSGSNAASACPKDSCRRSPIHARLLPLLDDIYGPIESARRFILPIDLRNGIEADQRHRPSRGYRQDRSPLFQRGNAMRYRLTIPRCDRPRALRIDGNTVNIKECPEPLFVMPTQGPDEGHQYLLVAGIGMANCFVSVGEATELV